MNDKRLHILIADDDEDDVFLIKEAIRENLGDSVEKIDWSATCEGAMNLIENGVYDVCILDFGLGETNGIELLTMIREKGHTMPIIFLTGRGDQEVAVNAMKAGATDYFAKSNLNSRTLSQAIRYSIQLHEQEQHRIRVENALQAQEQLLKSVSEASNLLLTLRDHDTAINQALGILGRALKVDCAGIFQHIMGDVPEFSQCFSWDRESDARPLENGQTSSKTYADLGFPGGFENLRKGETVNVPEDKVGQASHQLYEGNTFASLILVPIIIEAVYWGFIAFGDSRGKRKWSANEASIIQSVAANIGGEIKHRKDERAFRAIVEGTSSRVGDDFFHSLVSHLASALPVRNAYVSELVDDESTQCCVLAGWENGKFLDNQVYNVEGTPYEEVLAGMMTYHPDGVQKKFRGHKMFMDFIPKSYAGVPCFDSSCKVIGHLSVLDDKPMVDRQRTMSILKIFAARAGAELERKKTEEIIRNMAYHDALTGLPNRVLLSDRLEMALANAKRNKNMLAVLFLDFDGFKTINDTLGHDVGDQLLKGVASRLKKCLRSQDTVARLGGDEFIILLPAVHSPGAAGTLAQKLLDVVRATFKIDNHEINITLSVGVSLYPKDGADSNALLKHADEALYLAKNDGKDCFHFFSDQRIGYVQYQNVRETG